MKHLTLTYITFVAAAVAAPGATFLSKTDFQNAHPEASVIADFEGITAFDMGVEFPASPFQVNSQLTVAGNNLKVFGKGIFNTDSAIIDSDGYGDTITLIFASAITEVGFDIGAMSPWGSDFTISIFDAETGGNQLFSDTFTFGQVPSMGFFGINGIGEFRRVEIDALGDGTPGIDNVMTSVPEPSAGLLALGALALAMKRRRH